MSIALARRSSPSAPSRSSWVAAAKRRNTRVRQHRAPARVRLHRFAGCLGLLHDLDAAAPVVDIGGGRAKAARLLAPRVPCGPLRAGDEIIVVALAVEGDGLLSRREPLVDLGVARVALRPMASRRLRISSESVRSCSRSCVHALGGGSVFGRALVQRGPRRGRACSGPRSSGGRSTPARVRSARPRAACARWPARPGGSVALAAARFRR